MKVSKEIINVCLYGVMGLLLVVVGIVMGDVDHKIASSVLESMIMVGFVLMCIPLFYMKLHFMKELKKGGDQ